MTKTMFTSETSLDFPNSLDSEININALIKPIDLLEEFIKIKENEVASFINSKILSLMTIWKAKLTKIYFMNGSLSSYDLIGISDEILKQQILIEAITKDDLIHYKNLLSEFQISDGVIYVPKSEESSDEHLIIKIPQEKKKGWDKEDFLAIYFKKDDRFYGYTSFEIPTINNPIKESLEQLSDFSKVISFMLDYYYFHNIAPYIDVHTGVYNKNYLNKIIDSFKEDNANYLIINIDVNNLKEINDTYGHLAGDEVIKFVAQKLKESVRHEEKIIRFGGDEFLIIVKDITVDDAAKIIKRIEDCFDSSIARTYIPYFRGISLGYAIGKITSPKDFEKLYSLADKMMYKNKYLRKRIKKK